MTSPFGAAGASPFGAPSTTAPATTALPTDLRSLFGAPIQPPRKGVGPKIGNLYNYDPATRENRGALILYRVHSLRPDNMLNGVLTPTAVVSIAPLDGGPYAWGGDPTKRIPHTESYDVNNPPKPGFIKESYVSNKAIYPVMEVVYLDMKAGRGTGIGLGRLGIDPATKQGYSDTLIISTNLFDADGNQVRQAFTEADAALAMAWLQKNPAFAAGV